MNRPVDPRVAPPDRRERTLLWVVIAASVGLFLPSLRYALTFDDLGTVLEHPGVQSTTLSLRDVFFRDWWGRPFGAPDGVPTFRPLATLTFWLDHRLGHGAPWLFHAGNLVWYALLLLALHRLLWTWAGDALRPAHRLLAVATFASLAIHADVVPSVTGRAELLTMLFSVLALQLALARSTAVAVFGAAAATWLSLLCKESAVPFALALPLLSFRAGVSKRRALAQLGCAAAGVAGVLAFRVAAGLPLRMHHASVEADNTLFRAPGFFARLPGAMDVLANYTLHVGTGVDLCADYSYAAFVPSTGWLAVGPLVGAALAALGIGALAVTRRRAPRVADALFGFAACYAIASSILAPATAVLADRLLFFPSFWLVAAGACALARLPARTHRLVLPALAAFVLAQAALTATTSGRWRDERSLALHTVAYCPHNGRGREMRAHVAWLDGDVEGAAWQLVARAALYNRYPAAVPDEVLSEDWENVPFAERLGRLRAACTPNQYGDALARATFLARTEGYREAEALLTRMVVPAGKP